MVLERLVFANPGGWWAFGAVAAVAALYLFRRRYRPLAVTGLFLWGAPPRDAGGGSRLRKPPLGRAFWLDVLAAACFALALIGPGWRKDIPARVLILDNSIAMRARGCHEEAAARVAGMWSADRPTAVIFAGATASVGREPAPAGRGEMAAWLASRYQPAEPEADLRQAVRLARDLYGDTVEIHLFTNRDVPEASFAGPMTVHVFAGRGGNLSLDHAWRRKRDGGEEIIATLRNHNDAPVRADLALALADGAGRRLYDERTPLPPGPSLRRIALEDRTDAVYVLSLAASDPAHDVIAADSLAFLPPERDEAPVYGVSGLDEAAARYVALALEAAGCERAGPETTPDLLITGDPEARGRLATLFFPAPEEPGYLTPPYLVDFADPLCRDVDLSRTAWVAARRGTAADPDEVYIAAGNLPLYWREGDRYVLNLSLAHGGLPRDPAWPVLMANLARRCRESRPGLAANALPPGAVAEYRREAGRPARGLALFRDGEQVAASTGRRPLALPFLPGLYRLEADGDAATTEALSVLPLYGAASDARHLADAARDEAVRGGASPLDGTVDLRWLALLLGCAALGGNYAARGGRARGET